MSGSSDRSCMPPTLWFGDKNLPQQEAQDLDVYSHEVTMKEVRASSSSVWW